MNSVTRLAVFFLVVVLVAALRRELQRETLMARADPLTGLGNTRSFYEVAEQARRVLGRTRRPLTLAYIDLDDVKQINDRLGHAAGDDVLRQLGTALTTAVRDVDTVARIGGDEFAVLLPDTDAATAARVLARVQAAIASGVALGSSNGAATAAPRQLQASIGAVTFTEPVGSVEAMVAQADRRMYEVKHARR